MAWLRVQNIRKRLRAPGDERDENGLDRERCGVIDLTIRLPTSDYISLGVDEEEITVGFHNVR